MHIRRLVKSGTASHTISLPRNWVIKNNLKKGDVVYVGERTDKELLITPSKQESEKLDKEITITIDEKDLTTVQREITSAYINNYNSIVIIGGELHSKVKDIRKILHDFVALEISELTGTKIVARDLLNLKEVSVDKTIRRMDMIIRSIIQDSVTSVEGDNLFESVFYRDFDVNKLYFLMCRLLKSALNDSRVADSFAISNSQAMSNWYLAMNLENIADVSKLICKDLSDLSSKVDKKSLTKLYKDIEAGFLDIMKAFYNKDRKLADSVALRRNNVIESCDNFAGKYNQIPVYKVMSNLKELENLVCNISRIVIDYED